MYDPTTGRFLSMDPPSPNGVDVLYEHPYTYARNNPTNRTQPAGEQKPKPVMAGGLWAIHGGGAQLGLTERFDETIKQCDVTCTQKCRIHVWGFRHFHESVNPGDDSDPSKFYTQVQIRFARTERVCDGKKLPDDNTYFYCEVLWPGRLIFPSGPLNKEVQKLLDDLESCKDFDLEKFCAALKKVPPADPIPKPKK